MGIRSQEPERITRLRAAHAARLTFAERVLDFAENFFAGAHIVASEKDEEVTAILLGFYHQIVARLWAIVVLGERGLPTSALTRELLEAVVSVAYITAGATYTQGDMDNLTSLNRGGAVERARRCKDYLCVRKEQDLFARFLAHDTVAADELHQNDFVEAFLGKERVEETRKSEGSWAGCSAKDMAMRAALPEQLRNSIFAFLDTQAVHALDADPYDLWCAFNGRAAGAPLPERAVWHQLVARARDEVVHSPNRQVIEPNVPERLEWHLLLACAGALAALESIGGKLGVNRRAELVVLHGEIETLWRSPG